jgi:ArsR family transcriptional regulator, arsenate/arsenite/antimonite-responsive transcriptional repressor
VKQYPKKKSTIEANSFQKKLMVEVLTKTSSQIIAVFHALSEPLRIQTIEHLQQRELCVRELLSISQSKLSFHLKVLKSAGLVNTRQEDRWIYYRLNLAQFVILEQYLAEYRCFSDILPAKLKLK